jgi:hypothetical protein
MKLRRNLVILIASLFALSIISSAVLLFSIKKIDVDFSVVSDMETAELQSDLDEFIGKNLLFFNTDKIGEILSEYPYFEVVSVKKNYPNVVSVKIRERIETYYIANGDNKLLVTDQNGFIVDIIESGDEIISNHPRSIIIAEFEGVEVVSSEIGTRIKTNHDELLNTFFEMSKEVGLYDCIKSVKIVVAPEKRDVYFSTYTGVTISITQADVRGIEKAIVGFDAYNNKTDDYYKIFDRIEVVLKDDGTILPVWTEMN